MCGEDGNDSPENWDGFLDETIEAPSDGPLPLDWPSVEHLGLLLRAAGAKWDAAGLRPPSQDGILLPPGYAGSDETVHEAIERLARDWRRELRDTTFRNQPHLSPTAPEDLDTFLKSGLSGVEESKRKLKLMVLLLKPNQLFGMHAHPTMELELTLRGALGEVRLVGKDDKPLDIPHRGPWAEREGGKKLHGPNLASLESPYDDLSSKATWMKTKSVTPGKYLFNEVGSIHKSYTEEEPFAGLVLWGGIHATVDADKEGTAIPNSDLLTMEL